MSCFELTTDMLSLDVQHALGSCAVRHGFEIFLHLGAKALQDKGDNTDKESRDDLQRRYLSVVSQLRQL